MKKVIYTIIILSLLLSCNANINLSSNKGLNANNTSKATIKNLLKIDKNDRRSNLIIFYILHDPDELPMHYTNIVEIQHLRFLATNYKNIDIAIISHKKNNNTNDINIYMEYTNNGEIIKKQMSFSEFITEINNPPYLQDIINNSESENYKIFPLAHPQVFNAVLSYLFEKYRGSQYIYFLKLKAHGNEKLIATIPTKERINTINRKFLETLRNSKYKLPENISMDFDINKTDIENLSTIIQNISLGPDEGLEPSLGTNEGPEGGLGTNEDPSRSKPALIGISKNNLPDKLNVGSEEQPIIGALYLQACNSTINTEILNELYVRINNVIYFNDSAAYIPINLKEKIETSYKPKTFISPYNLQQIFIDDIN